MMQPGRSRWRRGVASAMLGMLFRTICFAAFTQLTLAAAHAADEPEPTRELGRDPFATYPVLIEIGERGYVIPRNYIHHTTLLAPGYPQERVVLRLLWPGLEPLTPQNQHHWVRREPDKQIKVSIVRRSRDGYEGLRSGTGRGLYEQRPSEFAPYDLEKYQWNYYRRYLSTDSDYKTPEGTPLVFACNDVSQETKSRFDFAPICEVNYRFSDGAGLRYNFFMVNLSQWREIDSAVRALVDSFRR